MKKAKNKFAKSVIEIWLDGGPSQMETFDPKPDAPREYNGGLKSLKTNAGFEVHEWCPNLAKCANLYSVVRTLTHRQGGHETAQYLMLTGRMPGRGLVYPAIGGIVSYMKAKEYAGDLPPYVILPGGRGRFSETGFLGEEYAPLITGGDPNAARFEVDGLLPPGGLSAKEIDARFALAERMNRLPFDPAFEAAGSEARRVMTGPAGATFDLTRESAEVRDLYGRNTFGQSLLAARRLVEYGVPYIFVNGGNWDSHHNHFSQMGRATAVIDRGVSALLVDLQAKGLLESTVVWMTGEFGRTPHANWQAPWNGGRDHFPTCFAALVAGGGFKGGCAVGRSDETASKPVERPVSPTDFLGSICERVGIDPDGNLPNPKGIRTTVMPPASELGRLREIYA